MLKPLLVFLGAALVAMALIVGCSLDVSNLGMPVWTVEATIPFSERVYRMQELVTDSSRFQDQGWGLFVNEADSILRFEYMEEIDTQYVGNRLRYSSSEVGNYYNRINRIHVEEPPQEDNRIIIDEISNTLRHSPVPIVIQPFFFTEAQKDMAFDIFKWAQVFNGHLTIALWNHFPFAVDDITISIRNRRNGNEVGQAIFSDPIDPGESASREVDLSRQMVENELVFVTNGRSPGTGNAVLIQQDAHMELVVSISELDVDSTHAQIEAQSFLKDDSLELEDDDKVLEAIISSGHAFFRMTNEMPFKITCEMEFTNIRDSLGNPSVQTIEIAPFQTSPVHELDLAHRIIQMKLDDQRLLVENRVTVEDSRVTMFRDTSYQTINGNQGVDIDYWTDELTLKSFRGIPHKIEVEIPEQVTRIDLPAGEKNFNFTRDTLFIQLRNEAELNVLLNLDVFASNSETHLSANVHHQSVITPGDNLIKIPGVDLLATVVPDEIRAVGWVGIGEYYFPESDSIRHIDSGDRFTGLIQLKTPLRLTAGLSTFLTEPVSIKEEMDYAIQDLLLKIRITNGLPLAGMVKIMLGNDTLEMDTIASIALPQVEVGDNHRAVAPVEDLIEIPLGLDVIDMVKRLPLYTQQKIVLFGTEGNTVWIYANDSLSVQASAKIRYTVNVEEDNE